MVTARRILLVDDDLDDQELFTTALSLCYPQIDCILASNGLEAMRLVAVSSPFDLIFLDLNMPLMDGFDCLRLFKTNDLYKHIPVIILSTSNSKRDMEYCMKTGAAAYFIKPPSFTALFEQLKDIISKQVV